MTRAFAFAVALLASSLAQAQGVFYDQSHSSQLSTGGGLLTGNVQLQCTSCPWVMYGVARTTDAAPYSVMVTGGNASPTATAGNQTGGALTLRGGIGTRLVTVSVYGTSASDTIAVTVYSSGATRTVTTLTAVAGAPGANQFQCATSNDVCATNLATALSAISGITSAVAVANVVYITPSVTELDVTLSISDAGGGGAFGTVTTGTNGPIYLNEAGIRFASSAAGAGVSGVNGILGLAGGASPAMYVSSSTVYVTSATPIYGLSGALSLGTSTTSGSQGDVGLGGSGATKRQTTVASIKSEELTCAGGGGSATLTTTAIAPQYAHVIGWTTRVSQALTGSTGYTVGDGSDADRYGVAATVTLGTTTANPTAEPAHTAFAAAEAATITFTGGNCTGGKVFVSVHYLLPVAATQN